MAITSTSVIPLPISIKLNSIHTLTYTVMYAKSGRRIKREITMTTLLMKLT